MKAAPALWGAVGIILLLAGCSADTPPPDRHAGMRAAASPAEAVNSPENEVTGPPSGVVPLVRVETSNKKDEKPKVETILGEFNNATTRPAATQPKPPTPQRGSNDTSATTQP